MGQSGATDPVWMWVIHGHEPTRARDVLRWIDFVLDGRLTSRGQSE